MRRDLRCSSVSVGSSGTLGSDSVLLLALEAHPKVERVADRRRLVFSTSSGASWMNEILLDLVVLDVSRGANVEALFRAKGLGLGSVGFWSTLPFLSEARNSPSRGPRITCSDSKSL